ncbi:MAG: glycosyltransferase family 9 protein [Bryobacteraceae bacterium]|jgi:heptosyltransferase-1
MTAPRILVVRLGAMGDIIHALPAVASLKNSFPGARITWVVEPRWAPLLEANPFVDRVTPLRRGTARGILESWREIRSQRYEFAVDFQGLIKSAVTAACARPTRIFGLHRSQARESAAALFYSDEVRSASEHVVERNLDLAAAAGATAALRVFPLPSGAPEGHLPHGDFVLASPLAGWRGKQWPLEYYGALAARLRELGMALVLDGPESAAGELAQVAGAERHFSGLPGLIHATRRAAAVVGVDSGPMHLAAALGRPGVAIFGPTDPARNGPYAGRMRVLRSPSAATSYKRSEEIDSSMREISPDEVFECLRAALGGAAERRS